MSYKNKFVIQGTEAIHTYLINSYPQMVRSEKYEPHFFDIIHLKAPFKKQDYNNLTSSEIELIRHEYITSYFQGPLAKKKYDLLKDGINNSTMTLTTFEKTPSYMFHPNVPQLISTICPWSKIIFSLRDPIERAYSHFKMGFRMGNTNSFESHIEKDIEMLKQYGILADDIFSISASERRIRWIQYVKNKKGLGHPIDRNPLIGKGLYYMQLEI